MGDQTGDIYSCLSAVMADVGAIKKEQESKFGERYKFRGIDDVYNTLHPALVKHGVLVLPELLDLKMVPYETSNGKTMQRAILQIQYTFYASDGTSIQATVAGEGADVGDKAINKAHSSAFKNAIFQSLCIPTEERSDSEYESPEGQGKAESPKPSSVSPGVRIFERMKARCVEQDVDPEDYAGGALRSICLELKVNKDNAAALNANEKAINNEIDRWMPPNPEDSKGFTGSGEPTLGNNPAAMRSLYQWMGERIGVRDKNMSHDILHKYLPEGVASLSDLTLNRVASLKERIEVAEEAAQANKKGEAA